MSRISAGAALSAQSGPGSARNVGAPNVAPRPSIATNDADHGEVRRAKAIALGLFVILVIVHSQKAGD